MKTSYFYGKVMEQTYLEGYIFIPSDNFQLGDEYIGVQTSVGYWNNKERRYERVVEEKVFFWDVLLVEFEVGWKVKIDKEVVTIKDVIHRLDGSIEYHTDKIISMTTV